MTGRTTRTLQRAIVAHPPPERRVTRYTAHGKAIIFVVAMQNPAKECNPVCKLTDDTSGNESQSEHLVRRGKYYVKADV